MKKGVQKVLSVLFALLFVFGSFSAAFASSTFDSKAYTTIVTGSDFQDAGTKAYDRFARILDVMKKDGLKTPDTMLVGGDFTKVLFDYANPGITLIKKSLTEAYPKMDENAVIAIQGNHDNVASGFTKTGFYDMGTYCLYCINEDAFPWNQFIRPSKGVEKLADDILEKLNNMISKNDLRPVILISHVPLHHTSRMNGGDNKYASYIFNVINKAAKKLDIIFLFGHNHSSSYDDYIGGSVNFLKAGDTIRIPEISNKIKTSYTEEKLNFTYTNFGYVGYSHNSVSQTSTDVLSVGAIMICADSIKFTKHTENGLYKSYTVKRVAPLKGSPQKFTVTPALENETLWNIARNFFLKIFGYIYSLRAA